jgi:hypothetical protein
MHAKRIELALLLTGLAVADVGAIEIIRSGYLNSITFVLIGLAAASVGGLGLAARRGSDADSSSLREPQIPGQANRFSIDSLLRAMAFVGVWLALLLAFNDLGEDSYFFPQGIRVFIWQHRPNYFPYPVRLFLQQSPLFVPFVVLAYVVGRRSLSMRVVVAFALLSFAFLGVNRWAH